MTADKNKKNGFLQGFFRDNAGVVAVIFALALPMVLGAAGMAVDLTQAYDVKNRLGNALDKAALAGGGADASDEAGAIARATAYFKANTQGLNIGEFTTIHVDTSDWPKTISVDATAHVPTTFMSALGMKSLDVTAHSKVAHELAGVEAVLVLDVTGSMDDSLGGTTKITALKKAVSGLSPYTNAKSFLNIIFSKVDPKYVKIGIVPFTVTVNVGPYGLGKTPTGTTYGTPFVDKPATDDSEGAGWSPYVTPASNIVYAAPSGGATTNWWGCIRERASPNDTTDAGTPNWTMYRYPKICSSKTCTAQHCTTQHCSQYQCSQWHCTKTKNGKCTQYSTTQCDTYNTNVCEAYTCDAYQCDTYTCNSYSNNDPNTACLKSQVLPMTNNQTTLQNNVNALITGGNTYGNIGMAWGYHMMTPSTPFTEGVPLTDNRWTKTVIFMSDGDNTVSNTYSSFGPNTSLTPTDLNNKFLATCDNMKKDGITIYTIAFGTTSTISTDTRNMFKKCASEPADDHYFASSSGTDLSTAFEKIASQLAQLHIVE